MARSSQQQLLHEQGRREAMMCKLEYDLREEKANGVRHTLIYKAAKEVHCCSCVELVCRIPYPTPKHVYCRNGGG